VISQRVVSIADGIFEWGGAFSCKETILGVLYGCEEPLFKDNSHMYLLCFFTDFGFGLIVIWNCDVEWRFVQCVFQYGNCQFFLAEIMI
jgi:hypothetical protein